MKRNLQKHTTSWNRVWVPIVLFTALFIPIVKAQVTQTFTYTGGIQTFTVPSCVSTLTIDARGAQGGGSFGGGGGLGARMVGTYTTLAGTVYTIVVGQMGLLQQGGNSQNSSGGGGGSFVYSSPSNLLVAAGGGGGKCNYTSSTALHAGAAGTVSTGGNEASQSGALGGTAGAGGSAGLWASVPCAGGGAGWLSAGGGPYGGASQPTWTGGIGYCGGGGGGCGGVGGFGGGGGGGNHYGGGGGGGGYSGGGGGTDPTHGGGGGSFSSGTSQSNTSGFQSGNGVVIITYNFNGNSVSVTGTPSLLCSGSSAVLTASGQTSYTWSTGSNANSINVNPTSTTSYTVSGTNALNCISTTIYTLTVNNVAPVLSVSSTTNSTCPNNTVVLTASGAINYTWTGGSVPVTNGVPFAPLSTTVYTVTGQNGCGTNTAVATITVTSLPVIAISSSGTVCSGNTTSLSAGGATTYTWQPGNIVGANVVVSPISNTTYTVIGSSAACAGIYTIAIATNPNPTVSTSASNFTLCAGESSTLTASGALNYTWTPGGVGASIVVSPIIPTAYNVVGVNSFGCLAYTSQPVIAYAGPNMNIAASSTLICAGSPVTLNANGATTYLWNTGATTAVTTVTPPSTTIYTVVGSSPNTICSTTKTIEITVVTTTIAVSNPTAICLGESTTLNASGASTYNWSNGGSGSSISVNPVSTTVYTVTGISSLGGGTCASTATTEVTVNLLPTVVAASTRTNICRNESANLTVSGASTYSWSTSSTATAIVVSPTTQTTYTVVGTDANGCKNTGSIIIKVYACVGLDENASAAFNINIYPNPSSGEFNISSGENMSLLLINELGQLITELELNAENAYTAEVKGLSKGIYFITSKETNQGLNKKIVVQ